MIILVHKYITQTTGSQIMFFRPPKAFVDNLFVHCQNVFVLCHLPNTPSDWFNKELNDQYLGRKGEKGLLRERERGTWGHESEKCKIHQEIGCTYST